MSSLRSGDGQAHSIPKDLQKRDYFEPQQLSSIVTKAVSRGNRRTSKLSFLVPFTISSYTWAKILLGIFFSLSSVVSPSRVILACPTGCLDMLQFLLLFFCLYCNFILNVTSSKTSFASKARNTRKSLFKQPHRGLQSSILHTFSSPASGKCSKESLATFSTVSQETASKPPADCLTGQDGFDCWQWKNVLMERKNKMGTAKTTQESKCV